MKKDSTTPSRRQVITTWTMGLMIATTIVSLRGLSAQAKYGVTSVFYFVFAAVVFLIPFGMVCAELASCWNKRGGQFRWVSEAFGPRWGWAAIYLDWQMIMIWFPSVLIFAATALTFILPGGSALASNPVYTLCVVLAVYWGATYATTRGIKSATLISTLGGMFGSIIPAALLIILGIVYVAKGMPVGLESGTSFFPDFTHPDTVVLAASIFLYFGGLEMQSVHVGHMTQPRRQFPRSILLAAVIILCVFIMGTMTIAVVIPHDDIDILSSLFTAYNTLWTMVGLPFVGHLMAVIITFGIIGQCAVIIAAPSTGILEVGRAGYLPPVLQRVNSNGIQTPILIVQGVFVSLLAMVLIILPSVNSAYQMLSQMATIIYLIMCIIIYAAFWRLRRTRPNAARGFKVPGGEVGKWIVSIVGIGGALAAIIVSCMPPAQVTVGNSVLYVAMIIAGSALFTAIPFVVYAVRRPSWKRPDSEFEPFDWEIERRRPEEPTVMTKEEEMRH